MFYGVNEFSSGLAKICFRFGYLPTYNYAINWDEMKHFISKKHFNMSSLESDFNIVLIQKLLFEQ